MIRSFAAITAFFLIILPLLLKAQTASVSGRIINAETEEPIPGVNVLVTGIDTNLLRGASTNAQGNFSIDELPAGIFQLKITAIGYQTIERQIKLSRSEVITLTFRLESRVHQLNEIVVSAPRNGPGASENPTTVQRISAAEIERQDVATVADVARLIPAAHVATNSRGQTILYLRNSSDRQTAQFFNGALINVPWDNRVDLSFLPAAMLGGLTVSKGVPSVVYGTNTIGGAVNFRARSLHSPGYLTEVTAAGGYPASGRGSILHMGNSGNISYTAEVGYSQQSDYSLPADATLPFSQPSNETRVNTDRRLFNLFLQGEYQFNSGARLSTSFFHVDAEKGVAPESNLNPALTGVRYWRYPMIRQTMFIMNGELPLGEDTRLRGSAWINRFTQDIYQYQSVAYQQLDQTQTDLDYTGGLRLILEQRVGIGSLDVALNLLTTQHQQTIIPYASGTAGADSNSVYRQHIYSIGAEYSLPFTDRLQGLLGINYDGSAIVNTGPWEVEGYENYLKSAVGLSAGLTYDLSNRVTLHTVVGRRPRFPTMRELYGGALGKFVPNPDLQPVTAFKSEIGVEWLGTTFSGEVTAFRSRLYDTIGKITFQQGPNAGKEQRINLDGTRVLGIEIVAAARPTARLAVDGSLTLMRLRGYFQGEPRKLDEKPSRLGSLTLAYDLTSNFTALLQSDYIGGVYTRTEQNTFVQLPEALIFDARLSYGINTLSGLNGSQLFVRVNNITDELRLLQLGLPGPGRAFLGGVKLEF